MATGVVAVHSSLISGKEENGNGDVGGEGPGTEIVDKQDANSQEQVGTPVQQPEYLPRCFLDISIASQQVGRVIVELFSNVAPRCSENFRCLCAAEKLSENPILSFRQSKFHRVVKDFMIQGGELWNDEEQKFVNWSIYGEKFDDEIFQLQHTEPFLLSMANCGPNTNASQFFITTQPAPHLDNKHVVFGRVLSGHLIVKQIESLLVDKKYRPLQDVRISNCGELVKIEKKKKVKNEGKKKEKRLEKVKVGSSEGESEEEGEIVNEKEKQKDTEGDKEIRHPLAIKLTEIDEDEIPKVPENRFLARVKKEDPEENKDKKEDNDSKKRRHSSAEEKRREANVTERERWNRREPENSSGRKKIKGRGRFCFNPNQFRSRSRTPPHWRAECSKLISYKEYEEKEKKRNREERQRSRSNPREERQRRSNPREERQRSRSNPREERQRSRSNPREERQRSSNHREEHQRSRSNHREERQRNSNHREEHQRSRSNHREERQRSSNHREERRRSRSNHRDRKRKRSESPKKRRGEREEPMDSDKAQGEENKGNKIKLEMTPSKE